MDTRLTFGQITETAAGVNHFLPPYQATTTSTRPVFREVKPLSLRDWKAGQEEEEVELPSSSRGADSPRRRSLAARGKVARLGLSMGKGQAADDEDKGG
ncbi:MAG: hypothetical protein SGPRY_009371, partial [Prymnesium sp.]